MNTLWGNIIEDNTLKRNVGNKNQIISEIEVLFENQRRDFFVRAFQYRIITLTKQFGDIEELSRISGIQSNTLRRWSSNALLNIPPMRNVKRFASACGINWNWLVYGISPKPLNIEFVVTDKKRKYEIKEIASGYGLSVESFIDLCIDKELRFQNLKEKYHNSLNFMP